MSLSLLLVLLALPWLVMCYALYKVFKLADKYLFGQEVPDKGEEVPDEDLEDYYGSDELKQKNNAFDERIAGMIEELNNQPVGVLFDEPHEHIDKKYIPKPIYEIAD